MKPVNSNIKNVKNEVIKRILELVNVNIYKIYLYGSYARGDFDDESDVDIMIVLDCDKEKVEHYRKQVSQIASRIGLDNDIDVSLILRDRKSFEERQ